MNILICASTAMELPFDAFESKHAIELFVTGVGSVQTTYRLSRKLQNTPPDLCIQIGIAGSMDRSIPLCEVVLVKSDSFADLGAQDDLGNFLHLTQILPCDQTNPFEQLYLVPELPSLHLPYPLVDAISVNTVHGYQPTINQIKARSNAQIESMEGAAFFAVCMSADVPCLQIRSISNYVEPRNKSNWQIGPAIKNLHTTLVDILAML